MTGRQKQRRPNTNQTGALQSGGVPWEDETMNRKEYMEYQGRVETNLDGLDCVSTGISPDCQDCPETDEPFFAWRPCDSCDSSLGGDRYCAHGRNKDGQVIHFDICADCMYYFNYGQLDDQSMMDIEEDK